MTVAELIRRLQELPQNARVQMGYEGNYVSTEPRGDIEVVTDADDYLYAEPGDVFISGVR